METNKTRIKAFLSPKMGHHELLDDEDIFALGFVNSLFAMQLVLFVEKEFGITIENEDLELENFQTLNAVAGLVELKTLQLNPTVSTA